MAAYDYDYLGDLLKKVGGLMTQHRLGSGISVTETPPWVSGTMVRVGSELTVSGFDENYYLDGLNITEVGVYYRFYSTYTTGRPIYSEDGLTDFWDTGVTLNFATVITFTR
jgi:hypothetical protein